MAILPNQTIDLSVSDPSQTQNLSIPLYQGAGYRPGYHCWALLVDGGFIKLNLNLPEAIDVDFSMRVAAALVNGKADCPITITVNGSILVQGYRDTNANWHEVSWVIDKTKVKPGDNEIRITLDMDATTQFWMQSISVGNELPEQSIDLSVPNPSETQNLSIPLYQGAGYRSDFKTWSLLVCGGFIKFKLRLPEPLDVKLTFVLCASLVDGKPNCPSQIMVNGNVFADLNTTYENFKAYSWDIPQSKLVPGDNFIKLTLKESATTQLFIQKATVEGE
jgi:hypothetical protein